MTSNLNAGINSYFTKVAAATFMQMQNSAAYLEERMKADRPWTDRTGDARKRLSARAYAQDNHTFAIELAQGVDYGIYLELAHEKKYAIIMPTIHLYSNEVIESIANAIRQVKV